MGALRANDTLFIAMARQYQTTHNANVKYNKAGYAAVRCVPPRHCLTRPPPHHPLPRPLTPPFFFSRPSTFPRAHKPKSRVFANSTQKRYGRTDRPSGRDAWTHLITSLVTPSHTCVRPLCHPVPSPLTPSPTPSTPLPLPKATPSPSAHHPYPLLSPKSGSKKKYGRTDRPTD